MPAFLRMGAPPGCSSPPTDTILSRNQVCVELDGVGEAGASRAEEGINLGKPTPAALASLGGGGGSQAAPAPPARAVGSRGTAPVPVPFGNPFGSQGAAPKPPPPARKPPAVRPPGVSGTR